MMYIHIGILSSILSLRITYTSYNIARNKTAHQSSNFAKITNSWTADKAVDGDMRNDLNHNTCSVTDDNDTISSVWWYVDLAESSRILNTNIVYRQGYTHRLAGYSLYISQSSGIDTSSKNLCFKDNSNKTLPNVYQTLQCNMTGRYVTVYNERLKGISYPDRYSPSAVLELCEVEVYGCPIGKYGYGNCDKFCSFGCMNNDCYPDNGNCVDGCLPGWENYQCNECVNGKYGQSCEFFCSEGCSNMTCNKETGSCNGQCKDRWTGENCNVCIDGVYGILCKRNCSVGCNQTSCDKADGACLCSSGWSGKTCDVQIQRDKTGDDFVPLITGVVSGILILVLIATICVVFRRKQTMKRKDDVSVLDVQLPTESIVEIEQNVESCPRSKYDSQNSSNEHWIPLDRIRDEVDRKKSQHILVDEFKKLPFGVIHPQTIGEKKDNMPKNRFRTTLPYDHSRVILDNTVTDYINANYIKGIDSSRVYIATQGPKKNTIEDFWTMVWQEKSGAIVMLTNLIEEGKRKCEKYWPDHTEPLTFEQLEISLQDEMTYSFYTTRQFHLLNRETKSYRQVTQLHFITWPDHGTPASLDLMLFHRRFLSLKTESQGPTIIHCSAGIGRTGTFIALDAMLDAARKHDEINIFDFVQAMRQDRMNMIQTKEQYIVLHEALVEAMDYKDTAIYKDDFYKVWTDCKGVKAINHSRIKLEFQNFNSKRPSYLPEIDCKPAIHDDNKLKNRSNHILPVDRFRPYIMPISLNQTDYINAVTLPTYRNQKGFLVTQEPLKDTLLDFWCMVNDHKSSVLVCLDTAIDKRVEWYPKATEELEVGDFKLKSSYVNSKIQISMLRKSTSVENSIQLFTAPWWSPGKCPTNKEEFLNLLQKVKHASDIDISGPITVVCRDGATCCGLFCAAYNCLQRLQVDDDVDIYQTVKQLLIRRPEFCQTFEQYQFCYDIVMDYLNSTALYAN